MSPRCARKELPIYGVDQHEESLGVRLWTSERNGPSPLQTPADIIARNVLCWRSLNVLLRDSVRLKCTLAAWFTSQRIYFALVSTIVERVRYRHIPTELVRTMSAVRAPLSASYQNCRDGHSRAHGSGLLDARVAAEGGTLECRGAPDSHPKRQSP